MRHIQTAFIHTIGSIFILIGLVGILVPIIPGIPFLLIGMYIMSLRSSKIKSYLDKISTKYPRLGAMLNAYAYTRRRNHGHGSI